MESNRKFDVRAIFKPAMKNNPLVAIILVNWNGKDVTIDCLESLKKVDYSPFKVYVVDNDSTDDSVEEISAKHQWVTIIQSDRNRFFAGGNNLGWQYVKRDNPKYVLFLNNDTEVAPDFLNHLVNKIQEDSSIGMVGPKIYHYDKPDLIWSAGGYINFFKGKTAHYGLRQIDHSQWDSEQEVDYLTGCAQLIRADLLYKLDGYDESYVMYSEDTDICYRLREMGYKIFYVPESKIWHKISSSSGGEITPYKVYNKIKSNYKFFKRYAKWYHWITIPFFVFWGGLKFIFKFLFKLELKNIFALFKGFYHSLRDEENSERI